MYLFRITEHPVEDHLVMRAFEIVKETKTLYHIQPRMIPNKQAQTVTRRIKKVSVSNVAKWDALYFHFARDALQAFKERYTQLVRSALGDIAHAQEQIRRADTDLPHQVDELEEIREELVMPSSDCSASF